MHLMNIMHMSEDQMLVKKMTIIGEDAKLKNQMQNQLKDGVQNRGKRFGWRIMRIRRRHKTKGRKEVRKRNNDDKRNGHVKRN